MVKFKIKDICNTAEGVKNNIEIYGAIPDTVNVAGTDYLVSQFTDVMVRTVLQLDPNQEVINYNDIENRPVNLPATSVESVTSGKIYLKGYVDIADRVYGFTNQSMTLPSYANTSLGKLSWQNLIYMYSRILAFYKNNNSMPTYATVTPWTRKPAIGSGSSSKGPIQTACEKLLGSFTNFTGFYNKCKGRGYSYYYNDIKTLSEESNTIANLNCVDSTQLAVLLAREMGYEAHFHRVKCTQSGSGHVYGSIKGKEFGSLTKVDMAACMSVGSQYPLGQVWCSDAKILATDEAAWESDDGKT